MGITNLDQLYLSGVPVIAGAAASPIYTGNWHFVNETTGSDGNTGAANSPQTPFKTLGAALAASTANQNDVVAFTGTIHLTSSLLWNKNNVHLIGLCSPQNNGKRARISVTGTTAFNNLVNVSAFGCNFKNFGTFYGFNDTLSVGAFNCWLDTGGRNSYDNVEFLGFGDGTASTGTANLTGARAFIFNNNTGETTWRNCYFGTDTVIRNATNYTLEISGNAPRLSFEGCTFSADLGSSGASSSHLLIGAAGIDRWVHFSNCNFYDTTKSGGTTMTQAFNVSSSAGGFVFLDQSTIVGITKPETTASNSIFLNTSTVSATSSIAINNT